MKRFILVCAAMGLSGCAADRLNMHTMDEGDSSIDFMTHMVVYNVAKARYYKYSDFLVADYHLSAEQQVVNDSYGVNAGAALGGVHGIVVPNLSFPFSEAQQQQLNLVPTTDAKLLKALMKLYLHPIARDQIFCDGMMPVGKKGIEEHYQTEYVWVDEANMGALSDYVLSVLGADGASRADLLPANIYSLRQAQLKQQQASDHSQPAAVNVNAIESVPGPSR